MSKVSEGVEKAKEGVEKAKAYASETAAQASAKARETASSARSKATEAYDATKVKANEAVAATRRGAAAAQRKAGQTIQENPLTVLVGGLALGALAGVLLPKTKREEDLLGDVGRKVNQTASDAAKAARAAGKEKLDALGINPDSAKSQISSLLDGVVEAATSAGDAAAKKVAHKD